MKKKCLALCLIIGMLLSSLTACDVKFSDAKTSVIPQGGSLQVHFIDIGQGDSSLIKVGNMVSLIDTGTIAHYDDLTAYLQKQNIDQIDNFIVTHPDADHMGSAYKVIADYKVKHFYTSSGKNTSQAYQKMIKALKQSKLQKEVVSAGDSIDFGGKSKAKVIGPIGTPRDLNEGSVVIRLDYGKNSFLFTGDTTARMENKMNETYDIDVDVLKTSHHGSDTANGAKFISDASPEYSIISVGKNNYGHPDKFVMGRLKEFTKKEILRTDKNGSIVFDSNGKSLSVTFEKGSPTKPQKVTGKYKEELEVTKNKKEDSNSTSNKKNGKIIGNPNSKIYHSQEEKNLPDEENRVYFSSIKKAEDAGYRPCKRCN